MGGGIGGKKKHGAEKGSIPQGNCGMGMVVTDRRVVVFVAVVLSRYWVVLLLRE